jgi:hypothetical protein
MVRLFASILKVKVSNFTSGVCGVNNGKLIECSFIYFPVATLALGSRPKQGLVRLRVKREA